MQSLREEKIEEEDDDDESDVGAGECCCNCKCKCDIFAATFFASVFENWDVVCYGLQGVSKM